MTLKVVAENKPVANQGLVDELLELVARARAGDLVGMVVVAVDADGLAEGAILGDVSDGYAEANLELDLLKLTLCDALLEARMEGEDADD